jgi:hypothetical protein
VDLFPKEPLMKTELTMLTCALATAFLAVGCAPGEIEDEGDRSVDATGVNGQRLYAKQLGPDHTVAFYDFGDGAIAVQEQGKLLPDGTMGPGMLEGARSWKTLSGLYARLNPGVTAVPTAIAAADQRIAALAAHTQGIVRQAPVFGGRAPGEPIRAAAAQQCSDDEDGDGWGGQAFLDAHCQTGYNHFCVQNQGDYHLNEYSGTRWSEWVQMEGDWRTAGHINGTIVRCNWLGQCDARTNLVDHPLAAGYWERWSTFDHRDRYTWTATSPCGHAHVAFSWEMD